MFHLRFYKQDTMDNVNVHGRRYDSHYGNGVFVVTVYDKFTSDGEGVEFWVGRDYSNCYVTNESGKTVDRIGPVPDDTPVDTA